MQFRLLGPFDAEVGGRRILFGRRRDRWLMAVLLLHTGRVLPMDRLVDLLWDERPPAQARRSVQAHVARLRAVLAAAAVDVQITTAGGGYVLRGDPDAVDAHRFTALLARARVEPVAERRLSALREALGLWRGPALADVAPPSLRERVCGPLEEQRAWATQERFAAELDLAAGAGRVASPAPDLIPGLLPDLLAFAEAHPYREHVQALRMLALYRAGRRADAVDAFRAVRDTLVEHLGVEPGTTLQRLHVAMLAGDPRLELLPVGKLADLADGAAAATPPTSVRQGPGRPVLTVPRELPADVAGFTGRADQLAALDAAWDASEQEKAMAPAIATITGTAGLGKTALAVHWAHRRADRFPDGQLYLNLRGYGPDAPVHPLQALVGLIRSLGVPAERAPTEEAAAAALYRSLLAGRRVLVVLDNARSADQVRPLLPGSSGCMVVVTSRDHLHGLVAAHGALPIPLGGLPAAEARQLLGVRLGPDRVAAEPAAVEEILAGCAQLPLALVVAAARAAVRPSLPLAALAAELRAAHGGLDAFAVRDAVVDVRAVFSWSYRTLSPGAARLFRLLALHPGPDISLLGAASLAAFSPPRTGSLLQELSDAQLVTEPAPGRFAVHDLLRAYGRELLQEVDDDEAREAAIRRMLDHYLQTGYSAARRLSPDWEPIPPALPLDGVTPERFTADEEALAWFVAEHPILLRILDEAGEIGFDARAWQLARILMGVADGRGNWRDWVTAQQEVLATAETARDLARQADVHRGLARAHVLLDRPEEAAAHIGHCLELLAELGDRRGQARVHVGVAWALEWQNRDAEALEHARQALQLFRDVGHRPGQARALAALGRVHARLGDVDRALEYCQQSLVVGAGGVDPGRAASCEGLGEAYRQLGDHRQAAACFARAADLYRDLGDLHHQATALARLRDAERSATIPGAPRGRGVANEHGSQPINHGQC